jgi:diguanylate cyclase (GGDEF)-like protein
MSTMGTDTALRREAITMLRARGKEYYRHVDMDLVRLIGGASLTVIALVSLALLGVYAPTAHVSAAVGWPLAGGLVLVTATAAALMLAGWRGVTADVSLAIAFGTLATIGVVDALSPGGAPFDKLVVLVVVWVAAAHTPRRVLAFIAAAGIARLPTLVEAGWATDEASEAFVQVIVWLTLGGLALLWAGGVRAGRARLERAEERARALARVDQLTGLGNRRAFDEMVSAEIARAERTGRPLSVVVGDLDDFKAINDQHGHLSGDDCLRQVAAVVRSEVRRPDACFRWGGDEFALLLADTDLAEACAIAQRIQAAVVRTCRAPGGRTLTLGCGAAQYDGAQTPEALVALADRELLAAKS